MLKALLAALALACAATPALAAETLVLDFEDFTHDGSPGGQLGPFDFLGFVHVEEGGPTGRFLVADSLGYPASLLLVGEADWLSFDALGAGPLAVTFFGQSATESAELSFAADPAAWRHFELPALGFRPTLAILEGPGQFAFDNLTVSSGSIPEPATWALMLAGFGAAGAAFRRRRRILAPQIALRRAESGVAPWHDMRRRNP